VFWRPSFLFGYHRSKPAAKSRAVMLPSSAHGIRMQRVVVSSRVAWRAFSQSNEGSSNFLQDTAYPKCDNWPLRWDIWYQILSSLDHSKWVFRHTISKQSWFPCVRNIHLPIPFWSCNFDSN
jgi:hypothetical protein